MKPYGSLSCSQEPEISPYLSQMTTVYTSPIFLRCNIPQQAGFYSDGLFVTCPTTKLEDHPLLAVCKCLFNIFMAIPHIWRPSPPSAT